MRHASIGSELSNTAPLPGLQHNMFSEFSELVISTLSNANANANANATSICIMINLGKGMILLSFPERSVRFTSKLA